MALLGIRGTGTIIEDTRDVYFYTNKQIDAFLADKEDRIPYGNTSQFWRGDKTWQVVTGGGGGGPVDWADISNKPSTFPPTLPIMESDVTNLVSDLAAKVGEAFLDGKQYARQNGTWSEVVATGGGGAVVSIGDAPPIAPNAKDLWWKSDLGNMFIYYNDGTSSQWVPSTVNEPGPQGIQGIQGPAGIQGPQGVPGADSAMAPGAISAFARSTPPTGWLKANGALLSRTTYAALFAAIGTTFGAGDGSTTFALPDLRGEFPRFWDDSRGVDAGRAFGTSQAGDLLSHGHTFTGSALATHNHTASSGIQSVDHTHTYSGTTGGQLSDHTHTTSDANTYQSVSLGVAANVSNWGASTTSGVSANHAHNFSGTSAGMSASHTHTITNVAISAGTPAGTISNFGGTETRPRNISLLACIKY